MSQSETVELFTDGACRGNPGPGGWGVVLRYKGRERELYGYEPETTNNRMELTAAIRGLEVLKRPCTVDLTTDSEYLRKGVTEWMPQWKRRGWRTASNKPVANRDLWEELDALLQRHHIRFHWIRGHSGHEGNEHADALANRAIDEAQE
ncbi:ribonuclease HI [Thiohalorhabdus sp.]|uniref:ribonuclease HI n=1 Tax=Thiohalorhabdus sp. TaxID=3094134 RepID=UPI002FC2FC20